MRGSTTSSSHVGERDDNNDNEGDGVELEHRDGLTVAELIDMLSHHPGDAVVEMSIIAPIKEGDDDITVDRYNVDGIMPWSDDDSDDEVVWLIGGEDADLDLLIDAIEQPAE
jgi:hypothetical protein